MTDVPHIDDYAIIGDCRSTALVSTAGSIDWLCWPRFDSVATFAAILDPQRGGSWSITPRGRFTSSRRYLPNTNVLETRFVTDGGAVTVTDFMPLADDDFMRRRLTPDHEIVRLVRCEAGEVELDIRFAPRPNFSRAKVKIVDRGKLGLRVHSGHSMRSLHAGIAFDIDAGGMTARAHVVLKKGHELPLILTYSESSPEVIPLLSEAEASLARTVEWWEDWSAANSYHGHYRDAVMRSVLTLKLLEFPASGAFIAAATTSLPTRIGGDENWDYRFCWLRDAAFVMESLCGTGFVAEAEAFAEWMLHATRLTQPKLRVLYDVYGNVGHSERQVKNLAGHRASSPVRDGNHARSQTQLDTYGEVVRAVGMLLKKKKEAADRETAKVLIGFGRHVCKHWQDADSGVWEDSDPPVVHTHARLLCWTALDVLIDLQKRELIHGVPLDLFERTRTAIRHVIETESWNESAGSYTSEPGKFKLDATLLLIATHSFESAASERMKRTHAAIMLTLGAGGPLLYRKPSPTGMPTEGAFGICGFWHAQFLALGGGTLVQAEAAFVELLQTANEVGLFAEQTDPATGDNLGNFPQAFTHVGLVNAALAIERRRTVDEAKEEGKS